MTKESTQSKGFIVWLDFAKIQNSRADLLARPELIPRIPSSASGEHSGKIKQVIDAARITASVAASVLHAVSRELLDCSKNLTLTIPEVNGDFKKRILSAQEKVWYEARNTCNKVLELSK